MDLEPSRAYKLERGLFSPRRKTFGLKREGKGAWTSLKTSSYVPGRFSSINASGKGPNTWGREGDINTDR